MKWPYIALPFQSAFENGTALLFPTHLVWIDAGDYQCKLRLDLALVASLEQKPRHFTKRWAEIFVKVGVLTTVPLVILFDRIAMS